MPSPRVLLVELEGFVALHLTQKLATLGLQVATAKAGEVVERLVAEPPELVIMNLELSQGSGFGLVNRLLRMEALAGLKIVLVAENTTEAALDAHRRGPTPAAAYLRRVPTLASAAFAEQVLEAAQRLVGEVLPEVDDGDLVEVGRGDGEGEAEPLAAVIAELGYRVLRRLRDEDGGAVFACMDDELHRAVAIKLMAAGGGGERDERFQRFQRERRILALLHSPHVVAVYGAGSRRDLAYLVRELIDGESLAEQIRREGPLDVPTALLRARETALGLKHAAAAGVIHRDVRPENIHVVDGHAKLARFSMGKRESPDEARITHAGLALPDTTYVAPERIRGQEDLRGDIYALGVTLHTLIAGASPFTRAAPLDVVTGKRVEEPVSLEVARAGTPAGIAALVKRLMAADPAERPQSYDEVLTLLDEAARAVSAGQAPVATEVAEPEAVHGTLRLMSVVEIVQSLELARKTATVSLPAVDEPEGKLAFEAGRLVHAAVGDVRGEEAFFALVERRRGAFVVRYEPLAVEPNIQAPTTGLLLEAARRADIAARPAAAGAGAEGAAASEAGFFDFADDSQAATPGDGDRAGRAAVGGDDDSDDGDDDEPLKVPPRHVSTPVGLLAIVAVAGLMVYGGLRLPLAPGGDEEDPSLAATAAAFARLREQLGEAREKLGTAAPRLAELEAQKAALESANEAARWRAGEVQLNLEAALKPELEAGRVTLRLSDDGGEVVLEMGEPSLFTADGDEVIAEGKTALARIAGAIAALKDVHVRVEGHTDDSAPRGVHRNNWGLSGARALAVAQVLAEQGLGRARVKAFALADTAPVASNRGPKGRARNRRIELHLLPEGAPATAAKP